MKSFINQYNYCTEVLPENSVYEDKCKISNAPINWTQIHFG